LKLDIPKIYPITDTRISSLSHAEQVRRMIACGAGIIQLREKRASPREFYAAVVEAIEIARAGNVKIIINDRVDIALAANADGVHLGQDDLPPEYARQILGPDKIVGFSTHSIDQAVSAVKLPVDYIAIGPIFATSTKENPDAIIGLEGLRKVRDAVGGFPLVAIGGIDADNIGSVFTAGANSAAIISAILTDPAHIAEKMSELTKI
jgi:thiamine-phosphate pyrophosphorylase